MSRYDCPFCGQDFLTTRLLDKHLDYGCEMDSDFSDSSMECVRGSDRESTADSTTVRHFKHLFIRRVKIVANYPLFFMRYT